MVERTLVSNASVFSGRLEEFRLVELLQMMGLGSNTGALHLYESLGFTVHRTDRAYACEVQAP